MSDSSDTEILSREEILKKYSNNPEIKKYEKLLSNIKNYLIDTGEKTIDEILSETMINFFDLKQNVDTYKINDLMNKLSMLYNKLKQFSFFNLIIAYFHFIKKISKNIERDRTEKSFNPRLDIKIKAIYDMK